MKWNRWIFLMMTLVGLQSPASFDENARRYLSAQEIIQTLSTHFELTGNCLRVDSLNAAALGLNSPLTGNPLSPSPSQATLQWIMSCVDQATEKYGFGLNRSQIEKLKHFIGDDAYVYFTTLPELKGSDPTISIPMALSAPWDKLSEDLKNKIIANAVYSILGSDETIRDFGLIDPQVLREKLSQGPRNVSNLTVLQMIKFISVNLAVRDELLSY